MAGLRRRLSDRLLGPNIDAGGAGAGVQLWFGLPRGVEFVGASAVLEVLQPPVSGRRYRCGLQAQVVGESALEPEVRMMAVDLGDVEVGQPQLLKVHDDRGLRDPAVWIELEEVPDDPTVVVRWSRLQVTTPTSVETPAETVLVTFPKSADWRRLDVALDDVGVLQVTNTKRRTPNMAVLPLPPAR
jgi:hypothetical protein